VAEGQIPTVAGAGNRTGVPAGGVGPAALASRSARVRSMWCARARVGLHEANKARPPRRGERGVPGPAGQVRAGPPPLVPNAAYLDLLVRNSRLVPNAAYLELLVARPSEASAAHLDLLVRDGRKDRPARGQARRSAWRAAWRATG
ncbi:unnamed protein product, partial [Prorocentrum cordatum]